MDTSERHDWDSLNNAYAKRARAPRARILLADDHREIRKKAVHLLNREFEIVEAVEDGRAFVDAASRLKPALCILDISMPVTNGIEAATQLKESGSKAKIIFLTVHEDWDFVRAAFKTGA